MQVQSADRDVSLIECGRPVALVGRSHSALRQHADLVIDFAGAERLAERMLATLRATAGGYALAAPQIGQPLRLVVFRDGTAWVNPFISGTHGRLITADEGCLSLPGRWYAAPRWEQVDVVATNLAGRTSTFSSTDHLEARAWQHETNHLTGELVCERGPEVRHTPRVAST